ncbi:hypothetical protein TZ90_00782 [Streptococcus mitis]|uniref:Lipoprotein n=2 Tax=Streptococcus mitis TaxID=28037 RepID=A0A0F2DFN8_STRMT|nr:hypothetical protein TZ90_00782 [Streptococcus mitis]
MYSIKINSLLKISTLFIATLIFLVGCSHKEINEDEKVNIENSNYIVSLSRARDPYSKLLFLKGDGTLLQSYDYKGYSINSINYFKGKLFLTSNRLNEHYILDSSGKIEKYSNVTERNDNKYLASWFTKIGENTLIETVNIGRVNNKYLSNIIYSYAEGKKNCTLENQYLNGAVDKYGKIFVESYSENDGKNGITIIDKDSASIEKRITFKNSFTSSSGELIDYNKKLLVYGNNESNDSQKEGEKSAIGLLNCETYEINEYSFHKEKIIFSYVYENNIYIITDDNSIYKFNDKLEMLEKKAISDTTFFDNFSNNYTIRKIIHSDKTIAVLYTSRRFDVKNLGFIAEYNCEDISLLNKFNIILEGEKMWLGEVVDFIKLD